ncbi:hypothetical protein [Rhizobium ruizarguesonis]|uniref:hypothetical protein n=1 Tax=Rhizobium ruizarguesonis TaxID=2081791 RepID=UPI0010307571|nr:hypothetical protein [Rhizobium ruizarguesonis]TAZ68235.1 hypothetical protein ELH68_32615 [Rhizobium ruizarguesonis]TAZ92265.1 hypothetical protein ELH64_25685 [Rhizobium ruizarguesonis]
MQHWRYCTADDDIVSVQVVELGDGIQFLHDGANATEQLLLRPICPRDIGTGWSTEGKVLSVWHYGYAGHQAESRWVLYSSNNRNFLRVTEERFEMKSGRKTRIQAILEENCTAGDGRGKFVK